MAASKPEPAREISRWTARPLLHGVSTPAQEPSSFWTNNAGLSLDASSGSGNIHSDRDIVSHGTMDRHHVKGAIGGGGPEVHISTGSGNIRVH